MKEVSGRTSGAGFRAYRARCCARRCSANASCDLPPNMNAMSRHVDKLKDLACMPYHALDGANYVELYRQHAATPRKDFFIGRRIGNSRSEGRNTMSPAGR